MMEEPDEKVVIKSSSYVTINTYMCTPYQSHAALICCPSLVGFLCDYEPLPQFTHEKGDSTRTCSSIPAQTPQKYQSSKLRKI